MEELQLFDKDVETSLLGLLLINPELIYTIRNKIKPDMFSSSVHKTIYNALIAIADRGLEIDYVLLLTELNSKKQLEEAGGDDYIDYLFANPGKLKNLDAYMDKIVDNFKVRSLLSLQAKIPSALSQYPVAEVITSISKRLDLIAAGTDSKDTISLDESSKATLESIKERSKHPGISGVSTGFKEIDYQTGGLIEGDIWYIGARPSMGKSAFLLKTLYNTAKAGHPSLLFSKEMRAESVTERLLSLESGVHFQKIRLGDLTGEEMDLISDAQKRLAALPIYIDQNFLGGIDTVIATVRKYHQLYGVRICAVDYIQLLVERDEGSTHELGMASRKLKLVTAELSISSLIASQLNRNVEMRDNKRPMMSDLRQSGNLEEDSDLMAALYRDEVYVTNSPDEGKMEFIIRKQRNGPIGTVSLNFDAERVNVF